MFIMISAPSRCSAVHSCCVLRRSTTAIQLGLLRLPKTSQFSEHFDADLLGGTVVIEAEAERLNAVNDELYSSAEPEVTTTKIKAVPYCLWNNRGEGEMRVWIRES